MTPPRLAVALPVRNGANYLGDALASILAQDFVDFDLVVSDNASTDATPDILSDAARRDPRVKVYRSGESLTQVSNMNRAVALSPSPWIKLFCHDDLMRPDCLTQVDAAIEQADGRVGLIGNAERYLGDDGAMSPASPDRPAESFAGPDFIRRAMAGDLADTAVPAVTTATVRRVAFDQAGGFDERFLLFDMFLWFQLLRRWDFTFLHSQLTINRIHAGQVAFAARKSLRMVEDYRVFMPQFLAEAADELALSRATRWRMRIKPASAAATALRDELAAGQWKTAGAMLSRLPLSWWPILGPLTVRAWQRDRA